MRRLEGKVVVVTGAGSGIGRAMALGAGAEGAAVVVADRNPDGGEETVALLRAQGAIGSFERVDVASPAESEALIAATTTRYGRVDGLLCNAGVNRIAPALSVSEQDWDWVTSVNLRGAFFCAQAAARRMVAQGAGSIVFTSSQLADFPRRQMPAYIASKAALLGLTRCLALEWGEHGVRVNAIQPGVIGTPLNAVRLQDPSERARDEARVALGRLGRPADIVGAAIFLLSDESAYVTGASIRVDGGWLGP